MKITRNLFFLVQVASIAGILFIAGCGKQKLPARRVSAGSELTLVPVDEARLSDISIPIGVTIAGMPLRNEQTGTSVVVYETALSLQVISDFYHADMERLGWKGLTPFALEDETLLVYEKPHKMVIVSMRPVDSAVFVTVYLAPR